MVPEKRVPSPRRMLAVALGWRITVLLLSVGAQRLVYEELLNDPGGMRVISPLIAGSTTVLLALQLQIRNRQERLSQARRFEIIADMNHHIRNAMQVISYQSFASDVEAHGQIRDAMDRIDWAFRDVLPHVTETEQQMASAAGAAATAPVTRQRL